MNRHLLGLAALTSVVVGCGDGSSGGSPQTAAVSVESTVPSTTADAPARRALVVSSGGAIDEVALDGSTRRWADARLTADGTTIVSARVADGTTTVEWTDVASDAIAAAVSVAGELQIGALDEAGLQVALVNPAAPKVGDDITGGRTSSEVVVVQRTGRAADETYRGVLPGNLEPEMIGPVLTGGGPGEIDGQVFLIEYLPAEHPTAYRVIVLDRRTDQLFLPLSLHDKTSQIDEKMAAVSRAQVMAPDRNLLLTLYRGSHRGGADYTFVHTLRYDALPNESLFPGVFCLILPADLPLHDSPGAIAIAPDQEKFYVVSAKGAVASMLVDDIDQLGDMPSVHASTQLDVTSEHAPAIAATQDAVWVGFDGWVVELDPATLVERRRIAVSGDVRAIAVDTTSVLVADGSSLQIYSTDGMLQSSTPLAVDDPLRIVLF